MFELPAGLSFIVDSLIILLFFNSQLIFGETVQLSTTINPLDSVFLFVILAAIRIVAFLPYIWLYHHDRRLVLAQVPYLWHSLNFILIAAKSFWEMSHQTWDLFVWYILLGSTVSVCCQTICLRHLISTALPERHVILGINRSIEDDSPTQESEIKPEPAIIKALRVSLQDVRLEWNRKIDKLTNTFTEIKNSTGFGSTRGGETIVFEQLLILFTQSHSLNDLPSSVPNEIISNLTKLHLSYPDVMEFYIPQLTVFLLYGSFDVTSLLQEALLDMCRQSVTFAHRLHWFIVAFCLSGAGVGPEGVIVLHHLLKQIETCGIVSTQSPLLNQSPGTTTGTLTTPPRRSFGDGEGEEKLSLLNSEHGLCGTSLHSSVTYFRSVLLEKCVPLSPHLNHFTSTIAFWESLCELSLSLGFLPRESRTEQMRIKLETIQHNYLPSGTIYSPVSGIENRIWGIRIDESFAFSTKERAPMFICLEILEFLPSPSQKRSVSKSSWLADIRDGIKRAFLPDENGNHRRLTQDESQTEPHDEEDVERGPPANEELESSESSQTVGSLQQPVFVSEVGQWSESSPIKLRSRASFDTYNRPNQDVSPRRSFAIPLRRVPREDLPTETKVEPNPVFPFSESHSHPTISIDDDPGVGVNSNPIVVFKERWNAKEKRLRALSPVGHIPGYRLVPVIVKSNDDLRQEQCAGQLIFQMDQILRAGNIDCWLRPYTILALSPTAGLLEAIPDTVSFDVLRRRMPQYTTLKNFFESFFGEEESESFENSRSNFIRSLAAYCIVCYLLQIKDRHNGNILLDRFGHVIHIDFGFILGSTPGGNIGFESAPFKLTSEMVELMGGVRSPHFHRFRDICVKTYMQLRRHYHKMVLLLEMLSVGNEHLPFFLGNSQRTIELFRKRFRPDVHDQAAEEHVQQLINLATDNWTTTCYDRYQRCCVGVL